MIEKQTTRCRVREIVVKAAPRKRAEVSLVDDAGDFYQLLLEPGDSLDAIIDAWARERIVSITARAVATYGRNATLLVDVEKVETN